ncbi:MAG: hypothetical protein PF689_04585 [Deltaproteobacteria bacterium]|nr:hypothetical protein [Deltaproteobacteria bacterium]
MKVLAAVFDRIQMKTGIEFLFVFILVFLSSGCFRGRNDPDYAGRKKSVNSPIERRKNRQSRNGKQKEDIARAEKDAFEKKSPVEIKVDHSNKENKETDKVDEKQKEKQPGLKVLRTAKDLAFKKKKIVRGSCWDFVNRVYELAGFGRKSRKTIFKSQKRGPYADINLIKPGDWIYHVNLEYKNVPHSGIFVKWADKSKKIAKMLAYAGMNKKTTGRYKHHRLSRVFRIIRPAP